MKKKRQVLKKGRKHFGKGKNCCLIAISPFPTEFSKDFLQTHKNMGFFGKGLKLPTLTESFHLQTIKKNSLANKEVIPLPDDKF